MSKLSQAIIGLALIVLMIICMLAPANAALPQQCRTKERFECVLTAQARASNHWQNHRYITEPYECKFCGKYHLTTFKGVE